MLKVTNTEAFRQYKADLRIVPYRAVRKHANKKFCYGRDKVIDKKRLGWVPKGCAIENGVWYVFMRRRIYLFEVLSILFIALCAYIYFFVPAVEFHVTQPKSIVYEDGIAQLNIVNMEQNGYEVEFCIVDGEQITDWIPLNVGGAIGNEKIELSYGKGSYMVNVRYRLHTEPFVRYVDVPTLIVVGESITKVDEKKENELQEVRV